MTCSYMFRVYFSPALSHTRHTRQVLLTETGQVEDVSAAKELLAEGRRKRQEELQNEEKKRRQI